MEAHEAYNWDSHLNDIAVVVLEKPAPLSYFIWPACLYRKPDDNFENWILAGYDQVKSYRNTTYVFRKVPVEEIPLGECKDLFARFNKETTKNQLCGRDIYADRYLCGESAGEPLQSLIENVYYVGGITTGLSTRCNRRFPAVFTRIASYLDWIEERVWSKGCG